MNTPLCNQCNLAHRFTKEKCPVIIENDGQRACEKMRERVRLANRFGFPINFIEEHKKSLPKKSKKYSFLPDENGVFVKRELTHA
jgi:hypothetical protein